VFPVFVDECRDHIITVEQHAIAPYDDMATSCLEIDGAAVVEYARDLIQQGCVLDFGRHRRTQIVSQWLPTGSQSCTWDDLDDRSHEVDEVCCGNGECPNGMPSVCSALCAVTFHEFMDECGGTLSTILGTVDGRAQSLDEFEGLCIGNLDTHAFLEAIATAQCGDEVVGRAEECQEASDLSLTFLNSDRDTSGNRRRVSLNGDCTITTTGVQFDGDGDYFTVPSWGYASDSDFTVAFWFVKEVCTEGLYEYLFSHTNHDNASPSQGQGQPGNAALFMYLGCEGAGAVTSSLSGAGTIMRYWLQDDVGTLGIFDYPLHDAGSFDAITNVWVHTILVVTPEGFRTYDDGAIVSDGLYGFVTNNPANMAEPVPSALRTPFTTMTMESPLYIGGRSDLAGDRHFRGTMALLMIDAESITDQQAQCYFEDGDRMLSALPPVPPPVDHGMSCIRASTMMLQVTSGADGANHMAAADCTDSSSGSLQAVCDGDCGVKWSTVGTACAAWEAPPEGVTDCGTVTARGVGRGCRTQRQQSTYNQQVMKQVASLCAEAPPGCDGGSMMAIATQCNLPSAGAPVSADWRPRCPCDADTLQPLIACRDSFGVQVGMTREYLNAIRRAASDGCIDDTDGAGGTDFVTISTDGSPVGGDVEDEAGVFYQFHAEAGTTYLLDTEVGTLDDTVMFLIGTDQRTSIAENDDDERVTGQLDSFIEWTCPATGMYYINVKGYGGATGTITLSVTSQGAADDPCSGDPATLHELSSVISFTPDGGTADDESCAWLISCRERNQVATVTIERFSTEQDYDFVNLYDSADTSNQVASLTGSLRDLSQVTYVSSSTDMLIQFTSDASIGAEGFVLNYNCARPPPSPPPPPPPLVFQPVTAGGGMVDGTVYDDSGAWFVFDAIGGDTYQLETAAGTLQDTMMDLVDSDGQTTLVENDDDTRTSGSLASYIEWTCPVSGTYYINIRGYGASTGTFQVSISAPSQDSPCGGGVTMNEPLATISFMPEGGTEDDQTCVWTISCPNPRQHVELSFSRFDTEAYFDSVTLNDGTTQSATELATLSGSLNELPSRDYRSFGQSLLITFASDESVTGLGFEANYVCSSSSPPPPPVPPPPPPPTAHSFTSVAATGQMFPGEAVDADGAWYQFQATEGRTYELDTEVGTLLDTMMILVDEDGESTLAENDDDERATGQLDSYIEWTCPASGMYFVNVKGYGGSTGTFSFSITETSSSGVGGGDPCAGGASMAEPMATISFTPDGGTEDNADCMWTIMCPSGSPSLTLLRFDVEQDYDYVNIYEGQVMPTPGECFGAPCTASLTGGMSSLPQTEFSAAGSAMTISFSSDASVGAEGFEAQYSCGAVTPPPPPGTGFTAVTIDAAPVVGTVNDDGGVWFSFNAQRGSSYQLDTEAMTLEDTVMDLVDIDQRTTIAENDDDTRITGRLDSFIEWTCPASGTYYINVRGYGGATGTFSLSIERSTAGEGGDPCDGGTVMVEEAATISFMPAGGTMDNENCMWTIRCFGQNEGVHLNLQRFSTEENYDYVYIADGEDTGCGPGQTVHCDGALSGPIDMLPQREFSSTGDSMVVNFVSDESVGDEGFEASYECVHIDGPPPPPPASTGDRPTCTVEAMSTSAPGMQTVRLIAGLQQMASNIYTIFGEEDNAATIPAAYQVPTPFGADVGGANPQFFAIANNAALGYAQFDSWLTIGITEGDTSGQLSSIGVDFSSWTDSSPLSITNGALFMMAPDDGPEGQHVVIAQLTVPAGSSGEMRVAAQGRSRYGVADWTQYGLHWSW
jgi:hypothetical protein